MPICLRFPVHLIFFAWLRDWFSAGSSMLARMVMIAMTTNSSMRVKGCLFMIPSPVGFLDKWCFR